LIILVATINLQPSPLKYINQSLKKYYADGQGKARHCILAARNSKNKKEEKYGMQSVRPNLDNLGGSIWAKTQTFGHVAQKPTN